MRYSGTKQHGVLGRLSGKRWSLGAASPNRAVLLTSILLVLLCLCPSRLMAQGTSDTGRFSLGLDKASSGEQTYLPIILSPPTSGGGIIRVVAEISFSSDLLTFVEILSTGSEETANTRLEAEVRTDDNQPTISTLEVTISNPDGGALPSGVVANLNFQILEQPPLGTIAKLTSKATFWNVENPARSIQAETTDGEVEILEIPGLFACFFYMH